MSKNFIMVDDVKYIREDSTKSASPAKSLKGLKYVIVRTYSAGVFAGYLKKHEGKEGILLQARRLWYWAGAASLSQLATDGTSKPSDCKFPCEVAQVELTEIIEILEVTQKAQDSIASVAVWKQ